MSINLTESTFGIILVCIGLIVGAGIYYTYKKGERIKISYVILAILAIVYGLKLIFNTLTK